MATEDQAATVTVSLQPSGTLQMLVGDTLRLEATLQGTSSGSVEFTSSSPAVATVSSSGLVTARALGTASIVATSTAAPSARDAVVIKVLSESLPQTLSSVSIVALQDRSGSPISPESVRDTVFVRTVVESGTASRLEVLLDGVLACSQGLSSSAREPRTLVCPVDTARYDTLTGVPTFSNGERRLRARLLSADSRVLAEARGLTLHLANRPRLIPRVMADRRATDQKGKEWLGGDVHIAALPVTYAPDQQIARSVFRFAVPGRDSLTLVDSAAPFEVVLPASTVLRDVVADSLFAQVSSVTRAGGQGPSAVTPRFRYDSRPPPVGSLLPVEWVGSATRFAELYVPAAESDEGVGDRSVRFIAGAANLGADALAASGAEVAVGADLPQSAADAYRLAARVCDALENCELLVAAWQFGVDRLPPVIAVINLLDRAVNPREDLVLSVVDEHSGPQLRVLAAVHLLDADPATAECGPMVDGSDLPGTRTGGGCVPDTVLPVLKIPRTHAGYYTYSLVALDRAGNRSAPVRRTVLVDQQAPAVRDFVLPARLVSGAGLQLAATVADNLDLSRASFRLVYRRPDGGMLALPFAPPSPLGEAFDDTLATRENVTATMPFVQSLTFTGSTSEGRSRSSADSVRLQVVDAAGLTTTASRYVLPASVEGAATGDPFLAVSTVTSGFSSGIVCTGGCLSGDVAATTFSVHFTGEAGLRTPFERVYFFRQEEGGRATLLGSAGSAAITETGSQRTFRYSITHVPPEGRVGREFLFAVGVRGGNGFKTEEAGLDLFSR